MTKRMHRRDFLIAASSAASACALPSFRARAADRQRPNILFIMVDDLGKEWISAYGAEDIETPNIDKLAEGGLLFHNAYSMPQCTPSRVTLLTGQYPYRNGWVNHWDVPRWGHAYFDWREYTTFPQLLQQAGYATAAAGKWQINDFRVEPDAMGKHGFDAWCMWTGYETGNPPSAERYWDPYINTPKGSATYEGEFGPDLYTDYLIDFMRQHRDKPMMLYFPMCLTHQPFVNTPLEPDADDKLAKHKAMVRYTDRCVGRLVKALDEFGLRDGTIIVFTTDNGTSGAITGTRNGRAVPGAKADKHEPGVCQPFIVNCPGVVPAGETDALTDFTDLLPTFCDLAGVDVPNDWPVDGHSIAPVIRGESDDSPRDWICALGHGAAILDEEGVRPEVDFAQRVLRDKHYKVWVNEQRAIDQLYDLIDDPYEEHNLIDSQDAKHRSAIAKFKKIVARMPRVDARPRYKKRGALPWDKPM